MIPIKLTIEGLFSYKERQEIDFSRLNEAKLFGIFGAVGAGKSAIIDAISLALYGEVDRLNKQDKRSYNLMNLNSNELYVAFEFYHGDDPREQYKFIVKTKRNKKVFDDVYAFERTCYRRQGEEWISQEHTTAEPILGLSYDHFKRTMIIPQGKFQEFLQLKPNDRTQMMKDMFGLHRFDLYYKTERLVKKNDADYYETSGRLNQISEEISIEHLNKKEELLTSFSEKRVLGDLKLNEVRVEENNLAQIKIIKDKYDQISKLYEEMLPQKEGVFQRDKEVSIYEKCVNQFKELLDQQARLRKRFFSKQAELKEKKQRHKVLVAEFEIKEKEFKRLDQRYKKMDELKREIEELGRLMSVKKLDQEHLETIATRKEKDVAHQALLLEIQQLDRRGHALRREQKLISQNLPDQSLVFELQTWFERRKVLRDLIEVEKKKQKGLGAEQKSYEEEQLSLYERAYIRDLIDHDEEIVSIKSVIKYIQDRRDLINQKVEILKEAQQQCAVEEKLAAFVSEIKDDAPCPLCGSHEHPHVLHVEDVSEKAETIVKDLSHLNKEKTVLLNSETALIQLGKEIEFLEKRFDESKANLVVHEKDLREHNSTFKWHPYTPEEESRVEALKEQARIAKEKSESIDTELKNLEDKTALKKKELEGVKLGLDETRQKETELRVSKHTILRSFLHVKLEDYVSVSQAVIEENKREKQAFLDQIEQKVRQLSEIITTQREQIHGLQGECHILHKALIECDADNTALTQRISQRLDESDFTDLSDVQEILAQSIDMEKEKKEIATFKETLKNIEQERQIYMTELGNKQYDEVLHIQLKTQVEALIKELTEIVKEEGRLQQDVQHIKKEFETKQGLEKSLAALEKRKENLATLKKLFKANGFVNFISSQFLEQLCHTANERFYVLTRQQLKIELSPDNQFQIRDYLNGGKTRHIKTLSGGQFFQASFSMALALAEHIRTLLEGDQNFFFLDEGFGTLDKESLETVIHTLRGLHKENRIVGVISHVEELQQAIDVYVRVSHQGEEKGSVVSRV